MSAGGLGGLVLQRINEGDHSPELVRCELGFQAGIQAPKGAGAPAAVSRAWSPPPQCAPELSSSDCRHTHSPSEDLGPVWFGKSC